MLDPVNPKSCIKIAGSFERIAELLARYFYANLLSVKSPLTYEQENGGIKNTFKVN